MRHHLAALLLLLLALPAFAHAAQPSAPVDRDAPWFKQMELATQAAQQAARANQADEAVARYQEAVTLAEQGLGPHHPLVAERLVTLAEVLAATGRLVQADAVYARALALVERYTSPTSIQTGWVLVRLGTVRAQLGRIAEAVAVLERALAIHDAQPKVGLNERLNLLGILMETVTKHLVDGTRAIQLGQRRLKLAEQVANPGERAWYLANTFHYLGMSFTTNGQWDAAAEAVRQGLVVVQQVGEPERTQVLFRLMDLQCSLAKMRGAAHAEALCRQALGFGEAAFGAQDVRLSSVALALGLLAKQRGAPAEARPLLERAVALQESHGQGDTLAAAQPLQALAELLDLLDEDVAAEKLYRRTLAIFERLLGADHTGTANGRRLLANFFADRKRYAEALPLMLQAEASVRKNHGPEHMLTADLESDLAELRTATGDHAGALALVTHALAVKSRLFGANSDFLANELGRLTRIELALGHVPAAVAAWQRAEALREKRVATLLLAGSEQQKRQFLATLQTQTDIALSLHLIFAPEDPKAGHLALETLLRRKGRLLDAQAGSIAALKSRLGPAEQKLLDDLTHAQGQLAALVSRKPEGPQVQPWREAVDKLETEVDALQGQVSDKSSALRERIAPVTVEQVQALIPEHAALVEYASYRPFGAVAKGYMMGSAPPRYAAWVLTRKGDVQAVDLGPAEAIDKQVEALRGALASPSRGDVKDLARALDEKILRPVRALLGDSKQWLLAPDGMLNLVPFAALVDESGRWALQNHAISYLSAGRDLVRLQERLPARGQALVLANPSFETDLAKPTKPAESGKALASARSADAGHLQFSPLPGAETEGRQVAPLLPGAKLLTGGAATEAALKAVHAPSVLHLATHGFFLADAATPTGEKSAVRMENPLLRSGLALAGANQKADAGEDGLLTGLEAAGLDLWGTELVVLSACETGVGRIHNGDGVYGLRRALGLAGARTQVMSLWKVDDAATRDLMVDLYRRLRVGQGRAEALRQAQLAMLQAGGKAVANAKDRGAQALGDDAAGQPDLGRSHPYYWAAFIAAGDWTPMQFGK